MIRRTFRLAGSTLGLLPAIFAQGAGCAPLPALAQAPTHVLVPEISFGGHHDEELNLSIFPVLAVGTHGRVALPQRSLGQVLIIDPASDESMVFGGAGDGPGEFRELSYVGWQGELVWVTDGSLGRVTFFTPEGSVADLWSARGVIARGEGFVVPLPLAPGSWFSVRRLPPPPTGDGMETGGQELFALNDHWEVRSRLASLRPGFQVVQIREGGGTLHLGLSPFSLHPLFAIASAQPHVTVVRRAQEDGEVFEFARVTRISMDGDTLFHVEVNPRRSIGPISSETRTAVLENYLGRPSVQRRFPSLPAARQALLGILSFPSRHPPVTDVVVGIDGRTWLRGADVWSGPVRWEVLDDTGQVVASVEVSRALEIFGADGDRVWTMQIDEFGVPVLTRYRLARRDGGNG